MSTLELENNNIMHVVSSLIFGCSHTWMKVYYLNQEFIVQRRFWVFYRAYFVELMYCNAHVTAPLNIAPHILPKSRILIHLLNI